MTKTWYAVQMFRPYFIFDTPAIVLVTNRSGIFSGNISILGTFVAKFKINFPGKDREYPGSEVVPFIPRERERNTIIICNTTVTNR